MQFVLTDSFHLLYQEVLLPYFIRYIALPCSLERSVLIFLLHQAEFEPFISSILSQSINF